MSDTRITIEIVTPKDSKVTVVTNTPSECDGAKTTNESTTSTKQLLNG